MKAKLNIFSLLLFTNVSRLTINDMLGVELKHRLSGAVMLVLTLFVLMGGNAKAAINYVRYVDGCKQSAENKYISKAICLMPGDFFNKETASRSNMACNTGQSSVSVLTNNGFINISEREII